MPQHKCTVLLCTQFCTTQRDIVCTVQSAHLGRKARLASSRLCGRNSERPERLRREGALGRGRRGGWRLRRLLRCV